MPRQRRPPTVMARIRKRTNFDIAQEAKRIGIPKTDFMDLLFRRYKRESR